MKARSIARELALLGTSQLPDNTDKARRLEGEPAELVTNKTLNALLMKALKILSADAKETLETASGELQRSERLMLESETRTTDADEVRSRIQPALPLIQSAINRIGSTLELLLFAQQGNKKEIIAVRKGLEAAAKHVESGFDLLAANEQLAADIKDVRTEIQRAIKGAQSTIADLKQSLDPTQFKTLIDHTDVRSYACDLLFNWISHWQVIDTQLNEAMEKWNMRRLARVDRDILRLAMMEIVYMDVPTKVAIDEAIEMAKRYSDEDSYRFINGVLRRATDKLKTDSAD